MINRFTLLQAKLHCNVELLSRSGVCWQGDGVKESDFILFIFIFKNLLTCETLIILKGETTVRFLSRLVFFCCCNCFCLFS